LIEKAGEEAFKSQCIPFDDALLSAQAYKSFLSARRAAISERLNEYLKGL
jgi:hypothetical protein